MARRLTVIRVRPTLLQKMWRRYLLDDSLRGNIVDTEVPVETDGGQKRKRRMKAHGPNAARVAFEVANDRQICENRADG